jgi:hypothetical protein
MNNKNPLLFLNVDGVLTSARTYWGGQRRSEDRLDPVSLQLVQDFTARLNAEVVIASAWAGFICGPQAWKNLFANKGFSIPVVNTITMEERGVSRTWADAMDDYMERHPGRPHVLFNDEPNDHHKRYVEVNGLTGLTTVDLLAAAQMLEPGSRLVEELTAFNRGFGLDATIAIPVGNGPIQNIRPRDAGKLVDELVGACEGRNSPPGE